MPARLRLATEADAAAMLDIYAPYVRTTAISFEYEPPPLPEFTERVRTTLRRAPWLVCEIDGAIAGYAYAGTFRAREAYQWNLETTVYVAPAAQRRGVASALYAALLDGLRACGVVAAIGGITLPNAASVALHESFGFHKVGHVPRAGFKLGRWHDVGFWYLALAEHPPAPAPLQPPDEALRGSAWDAALVRAAARVRT